MTEWCKDIAALVGIIGATVGAVVLLQLFA